MTKTYIYPMRNIDQIEGIAGLPFDLIGPSPAFKPYKYRAEKALDWAKQNVLPIIGLALAVAMI